MAKRQLKLGVAPTPTGGPGHRYAWLDPEIPGDASVDIDWYIDFAPSGRGGEVRPRLHRRQPVHHPGLAAPLPQPARAAHPALGARRAPPRNIGLVGTLSTSYNEPFNVARRFASLDLISNGRAGWNVVTSGDAGTAGNYGRTSTTTTPPATAARSSTSRWSQALWDSYEDDAFPRDRETRQFLDPTKQHVLDHRGEYFSVVGPLNISRSPQGQPVIFQAGDSEQGRDLGARIGDAHLHPRAEPRGRAAFYRRPQGPRGGSGATPSTIADPPRVARHRRRHRRRGARDRARRAPLADNDFDKALGEFGRPSAGTTSASTTSMRRSRRGARVRRAQLLHPGEEDHRARRSAGADPAPDGRGAQSRRGSRRSPAAPRRSRTNCSAGSTAGAFDGVNLHVAPSVAVPPVHRRGAADPARARRRPQRTTSRARCAATSACPMPENRSHRQARDLEPVGELVSGRPDPHSVRHIHHHTNRTGAS